MIDNLIKVQFSNFYRCVLIALREHLAHGTTSLLDNLCSQHTHLIQIGKLIGDPNTDHPYPSLTHAIHNLARTLNIPSSQHSIAICVNTAIYFGMS